jgi:hypothetical protein
MKVQLQIKSQNRGVYRVDAFHITPDARILIGQFEGLIPEIKEQIEAKQDATVEIETSIFQGWY